MLVGDEYLKYEVEVRFRREFIEFEGNKIIIGLTSRPERGKANLELIKKLSNYFKTPSSRIKIISGLKSKRKTIEIIE